MPTATFPDQSIASGATSFASGIAEPAALGLSVTVFGLLFVNFLSMALGKLMPGNAMTTVGGS